MIATGRARCPALPFSTMATVVIPSLLRKFTNGIERVDVPGRTMRELIRNLNDRFPGIADQLIENGVIRPSVSDSIDVEMVHTDILLYDAVHHVLHFFTSHSLNSLSNPFH